MNQKTNSKNTEINMISKEEDIAEVLLHLGFKPTLKGYAYIKEAVAIYLENYGVTGIIKGVYDVIAQKHGVTSFAVERAMRISIASAWKRERLCGMHTLFNGTDLIFESQPTNLEFVTTISELIQISSSVD